MIIRLLYDEDVPDGVEPPRHAERDFEWEESMGGIFPVANPDNPTDILMLKVYDNETGANGVPQCSVLEDGDDLASFEEILKYGFVEMQKHETLQTHP